MTRPADWLRLAAQRLLSEQTMKRVIDPVLADLQWEYDEALARGGRWLARAGLVRSYFGFGRALVRLALAAVRHGDNPAANLARGAVVAAVVLVALTAALALPPVLQWPRWQRDPVFAMRLFVLLVPQALPLSIPGGLCVAVLWEMRRKAVTWRRVAAVLTLALAVTGIVWIVLEWAMPQANQSFREMVAARITDGRAVTLTPGLNELGLSRLAQRTDPAAVRQYQLLWALCFASVSLGILALGLARFVRRAGSAVALATVLSGAYFVILWLSASTGARFAAHTAAAAWTPNAVFFLIGCALLVRAPRAEPV